MGRPRGALKGGVLGYWKATAGTFRSRAARAERRLRGIAELLEAVDQRCAAADGPVTPTRQEISDEELRRIYRLARREAQTR